jgi:hypothetical protein
MRNLTHNKRKQRKAKQLKDVPYYGVLLVSQKRQSNIKYNFPLKNTITLHERLLYERSVVFTIIAVMIDISAILSFGIVIEPLLLILVYLPSLMSAGADVPHVRRPQIALPR